MPGRRRGARPDAGCWEPYVAEPAEPQLPVRLAALRPLIGVAGTAVLVTAVGHVVSRLG